MPPLMRPTSKKAIISNQYLFRLLDIINSLPLLFKSISFCHCEASRVKRGNSCGNLGRAPTNVVARHGVPWQSRWGCGEGEARLLRRHAPRKDVGVCRDCFAEFTLSQRFFATLRMTGSEGLAMTGCDRRMFSSHLFLSYLRR